MRGGCVSRQHREIFVRAAAKMDAIQDPDCMVGGAAQERKIFDERFIRLDTRRLCELTSAADALAMKPLVDLTSRALARPRSACPICSDVKALVDIQARQNT